MIVFLTQSCPHCVRFSSIPLGSFFLGVYCIGGEIVIVPYNSLHLDFIDELYTCHVVSLSIYYGLCVLDPEL